MKKRILILSATILLAGAVAITVFVFFAGKLAHINVKAVSETGEVIGGADVSVRFRPNSLPHKGQTNNQGHRSFTHFSTDGVIVGTVSHDEYYDSYFHNDFYRTRFGAWVPWGKEFEVVLRPKLNPVPMYVRNSFFTFPTTGTEVGFDLAKADWVTPFGSGVHSDFVFNVSRVFDDSSNFKAEMMLSFTNPLDGIQVVTESDGGDFDIGSQLRLPRFAPADGYGPALTKYLSRGRYGRVSNVNKKLNYVFRVRSEVDNKGNLIRALYGKIRGDIKFSPGSLKVGMYYYLNPDYTRNLEFDPDRNLFSNIVSYENVTSP